MEGKVRAILVVLAALVLWTLFTPKFHFYKGVVQPASYHQDFSDIQYAVVEPEFQTRPHYWIPELFDPPAQSYILAVVHTRLYGQLYVGRNFRQGERIRVLQLVWREGELDSSTLSIAW